MTSPSPFFRNFSNKENSFATKSALPLQPLFSTSAISGPSSQKRRIGGIGRAPKRSQSHNAKPYDRKSSTARAKSRATSPAKGESELDPANRRVRKEAPIPILTSAPLPRAIFQPPQPQFRIAHIPVRLPRPRIPPVHSLPGKMSHIPIEWALPRLSSHFPALLTVSSLFRPEPKHTHSAESSTSQQTFAFAVPSSSSDGTLDAKVKGREPDVCLAIKGKGREAGVARLLPVNSLVYASQCSFWPRSAGSTSSAIPDTSPSDLILPSISEESAETDEQEASSSDSDHTITSAPHSLASSSDSDSDSAPIPTSPTPSHILHLPLLALTIPHPPSFPTLHTHLHLPARPLIHPLLGLPSTCTTPTAAVAELEKLDLEHLMLKLEHMHGFWSNLCSLGINGEASWRGLGEAWGLVIGVLAARSRRAPEQEISAAME